MDRNYIVELIKANRLQEALQAIEQASKGSHLHNQAIILSASYAEYAQLNRNATQDFQTLEMQRAKITNSLLSFLDELSPDDFEKVPIKQRNVPYTPQTESVKIDKKYLYIGGALILLLILYFGFCNTEITENPSNLSPQTDASSSHNIASTPDQTTSASVAVNGMNVSVVEYSKNGEPVGAFVQKGDIWVEETEDNAAKFKFKETARDEWSVYLRDDSRGVTLQLDLYTKEVKYSNDKGAAFVLGNISHTE